MRERVTTALAWATVVLLGVALVAGAAWLAMQAVRAVVESLTWFISLAVVA